MYRIRKVFKFEAAHILDSSYSKCCQGIHGHSYLVELFFRSKTLNADGMVIDFGQVKDIAGKLIDKWDHALIRSEQSPVQTKDVKLVTVPYNPTAENMAFDLYKQLSMPLPALYRIRVHETATGWAEYEMES